MRTIPMILLLLTVPLIGCLGAPSQTADTPSTVATTTQAATAPVALDQAPRVWMNATGCQELILLTPIPASQARAVVPDTYTLAGPGDGVAVAFAGLKECADVTLDDESIGPASTSDVGVMIESPDGTDRIHYYQTWWTTDNTALHELLYLQGWRTGLVADDALVDERVQGLAGPVTAHVPWEVGAYTTQAVELSVEAPGETVATGWHDGALGTVNVPKVLSSSVQSAGPGVLTADGGSPMAQLIGTGPVPGAALYNEYTMVGSLGPVGS